MSRRKQAKPIRLQDDVESTPLGLNGKNHFFKLIFIKMNLCTSIDFSFLLQPNYRYIFRRLILVFTVTLRSISKPENQ